MALFTTHFLPARRRAVAAAALTLALVTGGLLVAPAAAHAAGTTSTWTGLGGDGLWSTASNWDHIPAPGDDLSFPDDTTSRNDFPVGTRFGSLEVGDRFLLSGNAVDLRTIDTSAPGSEAYFDLPVVASGPLVVTGAVGSYTHFLSDVSGPGDLTFTGPNNVYVYGADPDLSGTTTIDGGFVLLTSERTRLADVVLNGGTIQIDSATVGALTARGGTVLSGGPQKASTLSLARGVSFQPLPDGAASTSQLVVDGPVDLGGATLEGFSDYTPTPGYVRTMVTSSGPLTGTFDGLPNGSVVTLLGYRDDPEWPWRVDYGPRIATLTALAPTTTTLAPVSTTPVASDAPQELVARIAATAGGQTPVGRVQFTQDGQPLGTVDVVDGAARLTAELRAGTHTIAASFVDGVAAGFAPSSTTGTATSVTVLDRPAITGSTTATGTLGAPFTYSPVATGTALSFTSTALPAGLSLDPRTGSVTGTPTAVGSSTIAITVTNAVGSATIDVTLDIEVGVLARITVSPSDTAVDAGTSVSYSVQGYDGFGNALGDLTSSATFSSDVASDVTTGNSIRFSAAGPRSVTAAVGGITASSPVVVAAGPLAAIRVSPDASSVTAGDSVRFGVEGFDSEGNTLGAQPAVLTTDDPHGTISGTSVTFATVGAHHVTATVGAVRAVVTTKVAVDPAAVDSITLTVPASGVRVGDTVTARVTAQDRFGNDLGDVTDRATLTTDYASDTIDGSTITFGSASTRTVTATLDGHSSTATVSVVARDGRPVPSSVLSVTTPASPVGQLAFTGTESAIALPVGLGILGAGIVLLALTAIRRRRRA